MNGENRDLASNSLQEGRDVQDFEKNKEAAAETIRKRLFKLQALFKEFETKYRDFLEFARQKLQLAKVLKSETEATMKEMISMWEDLYASFKKLPIDTLKIDNYDGLVCDENDNRFISLMDNFDEMEEYVQNLIYKVHEHSDSI